MIENRNTKQEIEEKQERRLLIKNGKVVIKKEWKVRSIMNQDSPP